jgi:hypothetical protein
MINSTANCGKLNTINTSDRSGDLILWYEVIFNEDLIKHTLLAGSIGIS